MTFTIKNTKKHPIVIGGENIGVNELGGGISVPEVIISPLTTEVNFTQFESNLPSTFFKGLSDIQTIPLHFNWRYDKEKGGAISKPQNQRLCGSCWATAAATIIADNFVVKGLNIDEDGKKFIPDLSTTWILIKYPQLMCGGGNPAIAFSNIVNASKNGEGGIASNRCLDYSWCATNSMCNGDAKKHMDANPQKLNELIPYNAGCYSNKNKHYIFDIYKNPISVGIGMTKKDGTKIQENEWNSYKMEIKKHIYTNGPVLGGFLVFKNFMKGDWCKTLPNKGIYLENGIYTSLNNINFDSKQTDSSNYKGAHSISIIGWGIEHNVTTGEGKKESVEYWYCRNSWTEKWGDGGYFKMAMYPHNKLSQFDKIVDITSPKGKNQSGGIVMIECSEKPKLVDIGLVTTKKGIIPNTIKDKSWYTQNASSNLIKNIQTIDKDDSDKDDSDKDDSDKDDSVNTLKTNYLVYLALVSYMSILFYLFKKSTIDKKIIIFSSFLIFIIIIFNLN